MMIDLNKILRTQPKSTFKFDREERSWYLEKPHRIEYESISTLDDIHVETTLTELLRMTRLHWRGHKNQYLTERWNRCGLSPVEFQENFDDTIYEQQLTQRLGRGILTQTPLLEWVTLQEATEIFQVSYKVVNRWIREGKLHALQYKKGYRKLIFIDDSFLAIGLLNPKRSLSDNKHWLSARFRILEYEPTTNRYRKWMLPQASMERDFPHLYADEFIRSLLDTSVDSRHKKGLSMTVAEGELKKKYKTPYITADLDFYRVLRSRSRIRRLGRPPLRYFTTEEAAYYLRLSKLAIIKAVSSGRLTPLKTESGKHFIFEKETLLQFIGPSTNPLDQDKASQKICRWVDSEFKSEYTAKVQPESFTRSFLSERDFLLETYQIEKAYYELCSASLEFRANNLFFYNQLFPPENKETYRSDALLNIARYKPPLIKKSPEKKRKPEKERKLVNSPL